ncbi:hypothetical protein J6590_007387 [Homalodisca vitripennis]|nr:hypothetical protein J6590_007387 [Homalodisca vitripennis]
MIGILRSTVPSVYSRPRYQLFSDARSADVTLTSHVTTQQLFCPAESFILSDAYHVNGTILVPSRPRLPHHVSCHLQPTRL